MSMIRSLEANEINQVYGGDMSTGEASVMNLFSSSGSVECSGSNWAITSNGNVFVDLDGDHFYDLAGNFEEGQQWDSSTDSWVGGFDVEAFSPAPFVCPNNVQG